MLWEASDVVRLPSNALFRHEGSWATYLVKSGRAVLHPVEVGHQNGFVAEAIDSVEPGDRVIVHPSDQVRDGIAIEERD